MGIFLINPDFDEDIKRLPREPVILNQHHAGFEGVDVVKALMVTEYDCDYIDTMPSCGCGRSRGRHLNKCSYCGDEVLSVMERGFYSDVWLQAPPGVRAFIRPNILGMMLESFTQEGFSAIEWLCNPRYKFTDEYSIVYRQFMALEIPRGYNHFIDNFDDILETLMNARIFKNNMQRRRDTYTCIKENRHLLFPQHLPLPNKRSIITETSTRAKTAVKSMFTIVDAARALYSIVGNEETMSQSRKEYHVFRALQMMIDFRVFVDKKIIGQKEGWIRKQVVGTRDGPSFRGVITSLAGIHEYDEIHLPWAMSIAVYMPQLISKLMRKGFTPNAARGYLIRTMSRFDPELHAIFDELKEESGYKGLPILLGRNPTLNLRSIQALYVTKVKSNIHDNTISLSVHILRSPNADFDGDQLGGKPILSHSDWRVARKLSPESGLADLNKPNAMTSNMGLGAPVLATINNLMYGRAA